MSSKHKQHKVKVARYGNGNFVSFNCMMLKGVLQSPAAFAIVCCCFCEFRTVRYSGSCGEQVVYFVQSMLVFVLPLIEIFMAAEAANLILSFQFPQLCRRSVLTVTSVNLMISVHR